jgi:hypothetical protein
MKVCLCVYIYIRMYIYIYMCVCVCVCVCMCEYIHTQTHNTHVCVQNTLMYLDIQARRKYIHTHMHTFICKAQTYVHRVPEKPWAWCRAVLWALKQPVPNVSVGVCECVLMCWFTFYAHAWHTGPCVCDKQSLDARVFSHPKNASYLGRFVSKHTSAEVHAHRNIHVYVYAHTHTRV